MDLHIVSDEESGFSMFVKNQGETSAWVVKVNIHSIIDKVSHFKWKATDFWKSQHRPHESLPIFL